jgi:hypothetical protein
LGEKKEKKKEKGKLSKSCLGGGLGDPLIDIDPKHCYEDIHQSL